VRDAKLDETVNVALETAMSNARAVVPKAYVTETPPSNEIGLPDAVYPDPEKVSVARSGAGAGMSFVMDLFVPAEGKTRSSPAAGTPEGVQLAAAFQDPLALPFQVLVAPKERGDEMRTTMRRLWTLLIGKAFG
jgi:hypothetical protein